MDTVEGENRLFFIEITMSRKNTSIEYKKNLSNGNCVENSWADRMYAKQTTDKKYTHQV